VSKTDNGYRVYSIHTPSRIYFVRQEGERFTCACPDFEFHKADTTWRCKRILAVAPWLKTEHAEVPMPENDVASEDPVSIKPENEPPPQKTRTRKNSGQQAQMLIKRSVSPDGRIDSVSVEFSTPVTEFSNGEIKEKAVATMKLQKEILGTFLLLNGEKAAAQPTPEPQPQPSNVEDLS
jgi:hypothetical protein